MNAAARTTVFLYGSRRARHRPGRYYAVRAIVTCPNLAWHTTSRGMRPVQGALEHRHPLGATRSDRLHHTAAKPERVDQRFGDLREGRRHDRVLRRCRRHAVGAVPVDDVHVVDV